jgi:hypothetical protein
MPTVYVFGAGASKHVGYPLASTMGGDMLSWMSMREEYRYTAEFIKEAFGGSPNIEDVITELDSHIKSLEHSDRLEDRLQRTHVANQRGRLRVGLPVWFREIHANPAPAYQQFAEKIVEQGDVIITFNYDDSLERELKRVRKWEISQGYGFQIGACGTNSQVAVLKLHGSMNWLVSILDGITSGVFAVGGNDSLGKSPHIATDDLKFLGYENIPGTFPGGGAFPSLILPGRTKEFYYQTSFGPEHEKFFSSLWSRAATALRCAEKLVLCGYSLLPVDQRACDLLLGEPRKDASVVVVSGKDGQRISNTFGAAGFQSVECFDGGHFETWVTEPKA